MNAQRLTRTLARTKSKAQAMRLLERYNEVLQDAELFQWLNRFGITTEDAARAENQRLMAEYHIEKEA